MGGWVNGKMSRCMECDCVCAHGYGYSVLSTSTEVSGRHLSEWIHFCFWPSRLKRKDCFPLHENIWRTGLENGGLQGGAMEHTEAVVRLLEAEMATEMK